MLSWPSFSQISLIRQGDLFCTDSVGARDVGRALKELKVARKQLVWMDSLALSQSQTIQFYSQVVAKQDSVERGLIKVINDKELKIERIKRQRWWFGGAGFAIALILILL